METVTSADGTTIAYDRLGEGPPVVLISGGSVDRQGNAMLAEAIPGARLVTLPDQWHDVDAAVLAPALKEFFG